MNFKEYTAFLEQKYNENMSYCPTEWVISDNLSQKITEEGKMNDFYGTTSVIRLNQRDIAKCAVIQATIFNTLPDKFVYIIPDSFHLTIHAFSNVYSVSNDNHAITQDIKKHEDIIKSEFITISELYRDKTIKMKALGASTSMQDVISLKFMPSSEEDYHILIDLYERFERIYPSGKMLIPHVSLGYFKLYSYSQEEIIALRSTLTAVNEISSFEIELDLKDFGYQCHYHMNDFRDIFTVRSLTEESGYTSSD